MIQAAIFDMDGLLIDSEPLWTEAEIEIFATVDIPLDEESCRETVGMGLDEVVAYRFAQKPWSGPTQEQVAESVHRRVGELMAEKGRALPGAREAIEFVRSKGARVGLASASDRGLIAIALEVLGLSDAFDHIQSANDLPHSKPHPVVYLTAAEGLGVDPLACLAMEDSITGLIAAKAARMRAVAVPDAALADLPGYGIADVQLASLEELDEQVWQRLLLSPAK